MGLGEGRACWTSDFGCPDERTTSSGFLPILRPSEVLEKETKDVENECTHV